MQNTLSDLTALIPANVDFPAIGKFILICGGIILAVSLLARLFFGRGSALNQAVSSAIGIIFVYVATILVYTFRPGQLASFLSPLPFAAFSGSTMTFLSFASTGIPEICSEVLSMIILVLLFNMMDDFLPNGKGVIGWFLYRVLTVAMAMVLHYVFTWFSNAFLPGALVTYAPTILLAALLSTMLLGVLKVILGLVLVVVNPIIGALYAFFFSSKLGKGLSKAVLTTAILCVIVALLGHFGYGAISISSSALPAYIPLLAVIIVLWYLIGNVI